LQLASVQEVTAAVVQNLARDNLSQIGGLSVNRRPTFLAVTRRRTLQSPLSCFTIYILSALPADSNNSITLSKQKPAHLIGQMGGLHTELAFNAPPSTVHVLGPIPSPRDRESVRIVSNVLS